MPPDPRTEYLDNESVRKRIAFAPALNVGARVDAASKGHGLILRVVGDRLVFAPPLVIEAHEIEEVGERLERALDDVASDLKREGAWN